MIGRLITREMLQEVDACDDAIDLFTDLFPNGVYLNRNSLKIFYTECETEWLMWAAYHLFGLDDLCLCGCRTVYEGYTDPVDLIIKEMEIKAEEEEKS